ncbi:MAG: asparagine synthase (glutamine-hydrolyzing) [Acidimicrobiales bacterium]
MCGIAGCYLQPGGKALAEVMSARIAHRGPDDARSYEWVDDSVSVQLAFRRLSIIDLSAAANQPFCKGGLTITCNGEIYNYRQIRAELAAAGVGFATSSDTEVLLEAWRHWGPSSLRRLRGMFAFALFDEASGKLILARDPLGIKPLYFVTRGEGVIFCSELKGIVAAVGPELRVDTASLVASMLYYWVPDQRCALLGVKRLAPGSFAELSPDGTMRTETYWDISTEAAEAASRPAPELAQVIRNSVCAHLVADVPVSSFLSGGLDSSIVTVLAKKASPAIDAYTIRFRPADYKLEAMPDDARYARQVADRYGIDLHEIEIAPDVAEMLPRIVDVLDEPTGDPAAINTFLMCEAARDAGVKVLLSGMGADELFGGYRKHLACMIAARYQQLPALLRHKVLRPAVDRLPVAAFGHGLRRVRWAKRFLTFAELEEEEAFRRSYTLYDPRELAGLLSGDLAGDVDQVVTEHRKIYEDNALDDHVNRMCLADARLFMSGLNLTYTDRASMAASTEVRVPFVDPEVFGAAFALRGTDKIAGGKGKLALKRAAEGWLPAEIVHRPKASFGAPLRAWMAHDLRDMVDEVLVRGELTSSGFLDRVGVERLVSDERAGREDRSKQLWQLLTLELWVRNARSLGVAV